MLRMIKNTFTFTRLVPGSSPGGRTVSIFCECSHLTFMFYTTGPWFEGGVQGMGCRV
jgi:hypothetical protein